MYIIFPFLSFVLLFLIFLNFKDDWRESFLCAALFWGVLLTAFTEVLSLFGSFVFGWLLACWTATALALALIYFLRTGRRLKLEWPEISTSSALLLSGLAGLVLIVGLTAVMAPPSNDDSLVYHMGRVAHWIQNRGVGHYPTYEQRQLYLNPWAEFAIANFQILSGGDRFANLLQWFSMAGSVIVVTLIAKKLGAGLNGQIFSAVIAGTIPMGILQGSSTQNDYVVAFWLACLAACVVSLSKDGAGKPGRVLWVSFALGLAILTKGTAYIYALPFAAWFLFLAIRECRFSLWKPVGMGVAIVLVINLGHYSRNYEVYGSPLTPSEEQIGYGYTNEIHSPASVISNITRNVAIHLETPSQSLNESIEKGILLVHGMLGFDMHDARTTWMGQKFRISKSKSMFIHEDLSGNSAHAFLIFLALLLFIGKRGHRGDRVPLMYAGAVLGAFLLFCVLLQWQMWHGRLHLPLFVLFAPFVALVFSKTFSHKITHSIGLILMLLSLPYLLLNPFRPVLGEKNIFNMPRTEMYYFKYPGLSSYLSLTGQIKSQGCRNIGLEVDGVFFEYLFWKLLNDDPGKVFHIQHVAVKNASAVKYGSYPFNTFEPCVTVKRN